MEAPDHLPEGATPLDPDEADGLIPSHISTRGELDAWEQLNIARASEWIRRRSVEQPLLTQAVVRELHRRMFSDTWTWAGLFRNSIKNLGVPPEAIPARLHDLLADTRHWIEHQTYSVDEMGCRFHHRLVTIHSFPNGNGRHARMMTDALLRRVATEPFTWGSGSIDAQGTVRERYIAALRQADNGDLASLIAFVRSGSQPSLPRQ